MKTIQKHTCLFVKTLAFALLAIALLTACSSPSEATKSLDTLDLAAAVPTANPTMPKVVLTIPPTSTLSATSTRLQPTATEQNPPTVTKTTAAKTPTTLPTEVPLPTATIAPTDSPPTNAADSACPQGCLESSPGCEIKGNINNEGVKIYHMPNQNFYDKTKISPEKGERWFCTPAEAEANGWRASKQ